MIINNQTNYNTFEIRKYFNIVADIVGVEKKGYVVYVAKVKTSRQRILGQGWFHQKRILIYLQKEKQDIPMLMGIIEHELLHNLGNTHDVMLHSHWIDYKKWESYAGVLVEEIKEKKPVDNRQLRYEKVLMKLTHYSAKLKRIENLIKKYESKKKYYDKVLIKN